MADNYTGVIGIVFQRSNPIRYILVRNKKTGNLTFPAGGREPGETSSKQVLERELREETGLRPAEYKIMEIPLIHEFTYNIKKRERAGQTAKQRVYLVEIQKMDLNPKDPDAVIDGWYTAEEVMQKLTFSDAKKLRIFFR